MTTILIVRHGNSVSNILGTYTGHVDAELSEVGIRQSELLCEYLHNNFEIDKIYSSDLSRAIDTVTPLSKKLGIKIQLVENLREIYGGKWEGLKFTDIPKLFPEDFAVWRDNVGLSRCTGGESFKEVTDRAVDAINKIAAENPDKTVVVATHGGLIRGFECAVRGIPLEQMEKVPYVVNASVSIYSYDNGRLSVFKTNDSEFLGALQTEMPKGI